MNKKSIRFRAAALIRVGGKLLVHAVENSDDGKTWYIPPGGGIRYGESSLQALERELREELGWEMSRATFIGSFENFHSINGLEEHEISFVYGASIANASNLELGERDIEEEDGHRKTFEWVDLESVGSPESLLYPEGLLRKMEVTPSP